MRFGTRAFALCFVPFALLLAISFWALQSMVQRNVRDQLRSEMRTEQAIRARLHARNELQAGRFIRFAGENPTLKAGLQLLNSEPSSRDARRTVEDQLIELSGQIGFRLLSLSNEKGDPIAWVLREKNEPKVPASAPTPISHGLAVYRGQLYHLLSAPIDQGEENLGYLTVGDYFDLSEYGVPVVLTKGNRVLRTNLVNIDLQRLQAELGNCANRPECNVQLQGSSYVSFEMKDAALGEDYQLRSLQDVDTAAAPIQASLRQVFVTAAIGAVFAAFFFSAGASHSIVRPLADVVAQLQKSEAEGALPDIPMNARIVEIRELVQSFNRAAASIRDARGRLNDAYIEFVGSLANALDARDRYTAGHSERVSQLSGSIAHALGLTEHEEENIRVGALLHDIGKIGIPDTVLQKPGVLSDAEFTMIKHHPTIGRRILQGVNGLAPYLNCVEYHHENWDGSGYPRGLREHQIPLAARIVHIADAWDAMTTDRPYRQGFSQSRALAVITINAGREFDPEIVKVFCGMMRPNTDEEYQSILTLAAAVNRTAPLSIPELTEQERS